MRCPHFVLVEPATACHIALNGQGVPICAGCGLNATAQDSTGYIAASKIALCLRAAAIRTNHRHNTLDPVRNPIPIVIIAVGEDKPVCAGNRVDLIGFAAIALIGRRNQRACASAINTLHLFHPITHVGCSKLHVAHCACGSIRPGKGGLTGDNRAITELNVGGIRRQVDLRNPKLGQCFDAGGPVRIGHQQLELGKGSILCTQDPIAVAVKDRGQRFHVTGGCWIPFSEHKLAFFGDRIAAIGIIKQHPITTGCPGRAMLQTIPTCIHEDRRLIQPRHLNAIAIQIKNNRINKLVVYPKACGHISVQLGYCEVVDRMTAFNVRNLLNGMERTISTNDLISHPKLSNRSETAISQQERMLRGDLHTIHIQNLSFAMDKQISNFARLKRTKTIKGHDMIFKGYLFDRLGRTICHQDQCTCNKTSFAYTTIAPARSDIRRRPATTSIRVTV
ncbi:hypothetical protein PsAD46_01339 [Pseudovibrio sp. Ad46]|nr:hypothetical protein PsAD46_01339 [Pseudovibrio sp. Ad46]KZK98913.1 hypothetical protein PsAD5_01536 [Pseudovibrio sp. Ad5]